MLGRCRNPNDPGWDYYGGRGIGVCERWSLFENFLADMGERPAGHTLDRFPDGDGNYEPTNCRWATYKQQSRNISTNRQLTLGDETLCVPEWAERLGCSPASLHSRLSRGWSDHETLTTPLGKIAKRGPVQRSKTRKENVPITIDGVTRPAADWARENGIILDTAYLRIKKGWEPWRAVTEPPALRKLTLNGETRSVQGWAEHLGLSLKMLKSRLARGWSEERALTEPWRRPGCYPRRASQRTRC